MLKNQVFRRSGGGRRGKSTGLSCEVSQAVSLAVVTTNCEKSAEVIVGKQEKKSAEGLNNITVQTNVCICGCLTSGCRRNVYEL